MTRNNKEFLIKYRLIGDSKVHSINISARDRKSACRKLIETINGVVLL